MSIHPTAVIHHTAVIYDGVIIMENAYIGPFCVIGAPPEMRQSTESKGVFIGANTRLEKAVVVDGGCQKMTIIECDCMIMSGAHIGHDASIAARVTISPKAVIGGHVRIEEEANIGMLAGIHQHQVIGFRAMVGGGAFVSRLDPLWQETYVWPYHTYAGVPAKCIGRNRKYADVDEQQLHAAMLKHIEIVAPET